MSYTSVFEFVFGACVVITALIIGVVLIKDNMIDKDDYSKCEI